MFVVLLALVCALGRRRSARLGGGAAADDVVDWGGAGACVPPAAASEAVQAVRETIRGFGPATPEELEELDGLAAALSKKHGVDLRGDQLAAVRTMEVATAARHSGLRAHRLGAKIAKAHRRGEGVLSIAARLKIAPLAVLRQILVEGGASEAQAREMVADPSLLPPGLASDAAAAAEADLGSRVNGDRTKARSQAYEDAVGRHLQALGVEFRTENDLRDDYERARARGESPPPLMTPDFVFPRPVRIRAADGSVRSVSWLDAKNYPLYRSKLVAGSLARQAEKYMRRFGPGAMVFSGGLFCGVGVAPGSGQSPLLLDGSHIGASPDKKRARPANGA